MNSENLAYGIAVVLAAIGFLVYNFLL